MTIVDGMESDTPRTDKAWDLAPRADYGGMRYMGNLAKTLEQEVNAANKRIVELEGRIARLFNLK